MITVGLLGLLLIVLAWIPETIKSMRSGKTIRLEFLILYFAGSVLLTLHAVNIGDYVFIILNGLASILSGANIVRYLWGKLR